MDNVMREICDAIKKGDPQNADKLLERYMQDPERQNDMTAVLDASIGALYGDKMRVWNAIRNGLLFNFQALG